MRNLIKITLAALVLTSCEVDPIDEFEPFIEDIKTFVEPKQETETQAQPQSATVTPVAQVEQPVAQVEKPVAELIWSNIIGSGPVNVLQFDLFGRWENGVYVRNGNEHGDRVGESFMDVAYEGIYTLTQTDDNFVPALEYAAATFGENTGIFTSSRNRIGSDNDTIETGWVLDIVNGIVNSNVLHVRALANLGDRGNGLVSDRINETGEGFDKTIFVGQIDDRFANPVAKVGYEAQANYDEIIFTAAISTSHAAPRVAAVAANILSENPHLTPEELKIEILNLTQEVEMDIIVGSENSVSITERRVIRVLSI